MKRIIKHIKLWNGWRKHSGNSIFTKMLTLLGLIKPPTFLEYGVREFVHKLLDEFDEPEIKPLSWNHNHEDEPLMRDCKVTVDELHNIKCEIVNKFCEAGHVYPVTADELKTILDSSEVRATDDTVYVRTELTKDDIIEPTDFDFKKWLKEKM